MQVHISCTKGSEKMFLEHPQQAVPPRIPRMSRAEKSPSTPELKGRDFRPYWGQSRRDWLKRCDSSCAYASRAAHRECHRFLFDALLIFNTTRL